MFRIEVVVQLDADATSCVPQVYAFIAVEPTRGIAGEVELVLRRCGNNEWRGAFLLGSEVARLSVRIRVRAHAGAAWALLVRERSGGRTLLTGGAALPDTECDLVGGCTFLRPTLEQLSPLGSASCHA